MSSKLDKYNKLSLYHEVPGKNKKMKRKSIVRTLVEDENMNFETFVKVAFPTMVVYFMRGFKGSAHGCHSVFQEEISVQLHNAHMKLDGISFLMIRV